MTQIFAYYYPGYHPNPEIFTDLAPGWTEWELLKRAPKYSAEHYQPRIPLWGYEDETDEQVMRRKLKTAADYSIDSLLFINYWYAGKSAFNRPFELALDLAAGGEYPRPSMMWGNHNRYFAYPEKGDARSHVHLRVEYSPSGCKRMLDFWIDRYFSHPGYYRLPDGRLFFSIYTPQSFITETGSPALLGDVIRYLRDGLKANGLPEAHVHGCSTNFLEDLNVLKLGFDSCSDYISLGYSENVYGKEPHVRLPSLRGRLFVEMGLEERLENIRFTYDYCRRLCPVDYYPVVTAGRDCSPRVDRLSEVRLGHYSTRPIIASFDPEDFLRHCLVAAEFLEAQRYASPLVFINAWNEWTEGSYLEPDVKYGYGFLEAVRRVFADAGAGGAARKEHEDVEA